MNPSSFSGKIIILARAGLLPQISFFAKKIGSRKSTYLWVESNFGLKSAGSKNIQLRPYDTVFHFSLRISS